MLGVGQSEAGVRCRRAGVRCRRRVLGVGGRVLGVGAIGDDKQLAGVRCRNNRRRQTAGGC